MAKRGGIVPKNKKKKYKTKVSNKPISHKEWLAGYWKWRKTQDETR
tara:strand:+ start:24 stop:161 length:138 start_codon:yes stop_codon:yes gene_type:complete